MHLRKYTVAEVRKVGNTETLESRKALWMPVEAPSSLTSGCSAAVGLIVRRARRIIRTASRAVDSTETPRRHQGSDATPPGIAVMLGPRTTRPNKIILGSRALRIHALGFRLPWASPDPKRMPRQRAQAKRNMRGLRVRASLKKDLHSGRRRHLICGHQKTIGYTNQTIHAVFHGQLDDPLGHKWTVEIKHPDQFDILVEMWTYRMRIGKVKPPPPSVIRHPRSSLLERKR
ncbi:hypothetical protein ACLOJK_002279 [Asimina triloba]